MQFFFVLSGFVMTYVAEGKLRVHNQRTASAFLARRLARLVPAYATALLCSFALATVGLVDSDPYLAWPVQALFLQTLVPIRVCGVLQTWWGRGYLHLSGNGAGWFTSAIIMLSLCFPILYNLRPRFGKPSFTFFLMLFLICLRSLPTVFHTWFPEQGEGLDLYAFAPLRLLEFFAGVLAARLTEELPGTWMSWQGWGPCFDASIILAWMVAYVLPLPFGDLSDANRPLRTPPHGDFLLTGVFCLACVACRGAAQCKESDKSSTSLISELLASKRLTSMAEYSFAAYIMQCPLKAFWPGPLMSFLWPVHVTICWAVGWNVWVHVEGPFRDMIERQLRGPLLKQDTHKAAGTSTFA
jgi:peptidoglycan/LPS O-acetylase OafA/YrhL